MPIILLFILCIFWSDSALANDSSINTQVQQLLKQDKWTENVELVMANLEHCHAITLLHTALAAKQVGQIKRAAFLVYMGIIRSEIDPKHYTFDGKGGKTPHELGFTIHNVVSRMRDHPDYFTASTFTEVADGLKKWAPPYTSEYDPGWTYEHTPNFQEVEEDFIVFRNQLIRKIQDYATLLSNEEYVAAYAVLEAYMPNFLFRNSPSEEKQKAEETLTRIETQLGIEGFMAEFTKVRMERENPKCFIHLPDGTKKECTEKEKSDLGF